MKQQFDWVYVLANLEEVLRLADIGHRYERAISAAFSGQEAEMPSVQYSDRFRPGFRLTPLQHQLAVQPHLSTNHEQPSLDRTRDIHPDSAAVRRIQ